MNERLTSVLTAWLCFTPCVALASGLSAPNVGSSKSGVVTEDAASTYWNPAVLGRLKERQLMLGANLIAGDIRYQRERLGTYQRADSFDFQLPIDPTRVDPSKTGVAAQVRTNPVAPAPSGFVALPLTERLTLGFGAYAPIAAIVNFDPEGAQRFSLQRAVILTTNLTGAVGFEVADWLSVGAGGSLVIGFAELDRVQDFAAIGDVGEALARPPIDQPNDFGPDAPVGVRELDVMARPVSLRRALGTQLTFNAGALVSLSDALDVGLSYQHSAPMDFVGTFTLDMDDDFFTQDLATQGLQYDPRIEGDASLSFTLPRAVHLGADWRPTAKLGLTGLLTWTAWSQVETFDVRLSSPELAQPELGLPPTAQIELPRRWRDTLGVELVARYALPAKAQVWAGGGYQSAASPDATVDVASPDGDRFVGLTGAEFDLGRVSLVADAEVQAIRPRTVVGSDFDLANGTYRLALYVFGVHGVWRF